jgi:LPXTG-motif cell wall-anchored protein
MGKENMGAMIIVLLVKYYKQSMVSLLKKNGVIVPPRASDRDIVDLIVTTMKVSKSFDKDLRAFLAKPVVLGNVMGEFKNFTEEPKFFGFTEEADYFRFVEEAQYLRMDGGYNNVTGYDFNPYQFGLDFTTKPKSTTPQLSLPSTDTTTSQPTTTTGATAPKGVWTSIFTVGNMALDFFKTKSTNEANIAIANATKAQAEAQASPSINLPQGADGKPQANGSNTGTYILLGVLGLAIVGGIVYYVRKKNQ